MKIMSSSISGSALIITSSLIKTTTTIPLNTINLNSLRHTFKTPPLFFNHTPSPLPPLTIRCLFPNDITEYPGTAPPEFPYVPATEPPSFPKEDPVAPTRVPEILPAVPPEIVIDPPQFNPFPDPNPGPKPDGLIPPLSPPGQDTLLPKPDVVPPQPPDAVPPRPPGPDIVPPPNTPLPPTGPTIILSGTML